MSDEYTSAQRVMVVMRYVPSGAFLLQQYRVGIWGFPVRDCNWSHDGVYVDGLLAQILKYPNITRSAPVTQVVMSSELLLHMRRIESLPPFATLGVRTGSRQYEWVSPKIAEYRCLTSESRQAIEWMKVNMGGAPVRF